MNDVAEAPINQSVSLLFEIELLNLYIPASPVTKESHSIEWLADSSFML